MRLVLGQRSGGLGDNLLYSTLPERFAEMGVDLYLSSQNVVRNSDIHELVWGTNPFIKGIVDEPHNIGDISFKQHLEGHTRVYSNEWSNGFEPINELPKIYYQPRYKSEYKDAVIVDISAYTTTANDVLNIDNYLKETYHDKKIITPTFKEGTLRSFSRNYDSTEVKFNSIFEYVDAIHSCHQFICWCSGQSIVASAINKENTLALIPHNQYVMSGFFFPNITYKYTNEF